MSFVEVILIEKSVDFEKTKTCEHLIFVFVRKPSQIQNVILQSGDDYRTQGKL